MAEGRPVQVIDFDNREQRGRNTYGAFGLRGLLQVACWGRRLIG